MKLKRKSMLKNALITWQNRLYITFFSIFASVKQNYRVMNKTYFYREFTFENGRWHRVLTFDALSFSDRSSLIRTAKRNGYVYDRNSRCYIRFEHGLMHDLITIRLNK